MHLLELTHGLTLLLHMMGMKFVYIKMVFSSLINIVELLKQNLRLLGYFIWAEIIELEQLHLMERLMISEYMTIV